MTSRDFCYWLQGYFEVARASTEPGEVALDAAQTELIERHLAHVASLKQRCTSGKPALFYSCEFNGDVPVCDQASIRRHREFGDARKSVADARNALVEEIQVRKRREDHVVYFADISTLFENVARAEARLALAEAAIRDAKKAAGQP